MYVFHQYVTHQQTRKDIEPADKMAPTTFIRQIETSKTANTTQYPHTRTFLQQPNPFPLKKKTTIHQLRAETSAIQF